MKFVQENSGNVPNNGEQIVTDIGVGDIIASSILDSCVPNLHLVDFGDRMSVIASDNAGNWAVGDEDDSGRNYDMIEMVGPERLEDFAKTVVMDYDTELAKWILDRMEDSRACQNEPVWFTADMRGRIGCHDATLGKAVADCEVRKENEPEALWEIMHG